ncbi:hypothetical protein DMP16_09540 [Sulfolobus sp. B1]|nr:hypothetical protein DJ529_10560 [Sulfolobus sp. C3]TRM93326.1 hypothetical protein DMP16_09540 [Sulfolobus sp. B1]TRN02219.1 hypothetical protein DJ527_04300 [Sulfolobus sp. F1]TRN03896.1 hypothetical protein DJ530_02290 [Sulfolobus sp. E1]
MPALAIRKKRIGARFLSTYVIAYLSMAIVGVYYDVITSFQRLELLLTINVLIFFIMYIVIFIIPSSNKYFKPTVLILLALDFLIDGVYNSTTGMILTYIGIGLLVATILYLIYIFKSYGTGGDGPDFDVV